MSEVVKRKNGQKLYKIGKMSTYATVSVYNGAVKVHVRRYTSLGEGRDDYFPTPAGIALSPSEFEDLWKWKGALLERVKELSAEVPEEGGGDAASSSTPSGCTNPKCSSYWGCPSTPKNVEGPPPPTDVKCERLTRAKALTAALSREVRRMCDHPSSPVSRWSEEVSEEELAAAVDALDSYLESPSNDNNKLNLPAATQEEEEAKKNPKYSPTPTTSSPAFPETPFPSPTIFYNPPVEPISPVADAAAAAGKVEDGEEEREEGGGGATPKMEAASQQSTLIISSDEEGEGAGEEKEKEKEERLKRVWNFLDEPFKTGAGCEKGPTASETARGPGGGKRRKVRKALDFN